MFKVSIYYGLSLMFMLTVAIQNVKTNFLQIVIKPWRFCFDIGNLFKNMSNNWINRKYAENSFCIPNFEKIKILFACFKDLREFQKTEQLSIMKRAHMNWIQQRYIHLTNIDKQKFRCLLMCFTKQQLMLGKNLDY